MKFVKYAAKKCSPLHYQLDNLAIRIVLARNVLAHFKMHRQLKSKDKEAGGQLFARLENGKINIKEATGPRSTDIRTRYSYKPDRRAEQKEILSFFEKGLHYVGDWHTHPSVYPEPSDIDFLNIKSCVNESDHELKGFVMIIIGTAKFPDGIRVSINDGNKDRLCKIKVF